MFENEYVPEWKQTCKCKSCHRVRWKHTILVMMVMTLVVVHFIKDFIRMIRMFYLTHASTHSLSLWQRYVCTAYIPIPRHVDAVNSIRNRQILVGCKVTQLTTHSSIDVVICRLPIVFSLVHRMNEPKAMQKEKPDERNIEIIWLTAIPRNSKALPLLIGFLFSIFSNQNLFL